MKGSAKATPKGGKGKGKGAKSPQGGAISPKGGKKGNDVESQYYRYVIRGTCTKGKNCPYRNECPPELREFPHGAVEESDAKRMRHNSEVSPMSQSSCSALDRTNEMLVNLPISCK